MGSHMNFRNFGDPSPQGESKPQGNFPLARQSSIYSLTFEELQNTWSGKDFGSMNMDELLKSIWTAEETQAMTSAAAAAGGGGQGNFPGGNLQRQGSLTLPRTLSQKTVDEVWRDLVKDTGGGGGGSGCGGGGSSMPQRQQTLNEMTLEEFLVRAGVVREEDNNTQQIGVRPNNNGFYMANNMNTNNNSLGIGFQHQQQQQPMRNNDMMANRVIENKNPVQIHPQRPHQQQLQQQPLFPKQTTLAFGPSMNFLGSTQLTSPGARNSVVNVTNPSAQGGGMGVVGLGTGSPANQVSPDVVGKSSGDASPLSPLPYVFGRGRKSAALEKVVERRHRRMIKNRESAARSRARKQAYTLELEAEVAKLKELNQELQRKQAETMEMQKNQILETMKMRWGGKRQCLRRTLTGPW